MRRNACKIRVHCAHHGASCNVPLLCVPLLIVAASSPLLFPRAGELSRIAGEKAIFVDKLARTFNFKYLGECDALELSSEDKLHIQSYVDGECKASSSSVFSRPLVPFLTSTNPLPTGLNSYVQSPLFKRPVEFTLTGERDPEFTIEDVTAMFRYVW